MLTRKITKYIWTYPASLLILLAWGTEGPMLSSPVDILVLLLLVGGLLGYIVDVVVSSIKSKHLEM